MYAVSLKKGHLFADLQKQTQDSLLLDTSWILGQYGGLSTHYYSFF